MTAHPARTSSHLFDFDDQARREVGDHFHLETLVHRGPNSLVYRTSQVFAGKPIALKLISKGALAERFLRAAQAATQMEHPHIVPVFDSGETPQFLWYTMPLVEGTSLDRVITEAGSIDLKRCLRIIEQVASALQYGHRRGVVHGNIKPENIIVGPDGWTLVSDFGMPGTGERTGEIGMTDRLRCYTAPELLESVQPVPASDQYSMAVLIHECLTGSVPSYPGTPDEPAPINPRIARPRSPRPPHSLPERVIPALRRAMAQTPHERFPSILGFVGILDGGPFPSVASSFAAAPNRKSEPRVLTMEPESRRGRTFLWIVVLGLLVSVGSWFAKKRVMPSDQFQAITDRFDRWYEADAPPGGIVIQPAKPPEAVRPEPAAPGVTTGQSMVSDSSSSLQTPPAKTATPAPVAHRATTPRPTVKPPVVQTPPPAPPPAPAEPEPGRLFVNATPWGTVYLDGRPVGNTPLLNFQAPAGTHVIRVAHDGFEPYERTVELVPGEPLRLTGIMLQEKR